VQHPIDPREAAQILTEGIGRRRLLTVAGALGAAAAVSTVTPGMASAATRRPVADPSGSATILQTGVGPRLGRYLPSTLENVLWGELPNRTTRPVMSVSSGTTVTIDTISHEGVLEDQGKDPLAFFTGHGVKPTDVLRDAIAVSATKPHSGPGPHVITGPVYVRGAQPGDVLKVEVLRLIRRVPYGVISNRHGKGVLPAEYPQNFAGVPEFKRYFNTGGNISIFTPVRRERSGPRGVLPVGGRGKETTFAIEPFLGTMGVALDTTATVDTIPPTIGGGNIDIRHFVVGTTLYLPVQVAGALFYTGDPHFAQGHGEVALTALEASLRASFRLSVIKPGGKAPTPAFEGYPFGETPTHWLPIGFSDTDGPVGGQGTSLDDAMRAAVRNALRFLTEDFGLDGPVAYAYLSAATDFVVSQAVDRTTGVHGLISKADLNR
jgi:acetamidase/formamidase